MSTASTQYEDERQLEFMMQKRHRQAALDAQIRIANASAPRRSGRARLALGQALARVRTAIRAEGAPEASVTTHVASTSGSALE